MSALTVLLAIARALHFASCAATAAMFIFDRLIDEPGGHLRKRDRRAVVRWLLAVVFISGIAWFMLLTIAISGLTPGEALRPAVMKIVWTKTHFGKVWQWRSALFVITVIAAESSSWASLICSVVLLATLAWAGHGLTGTLPAVHLVSDIIHLLATAVWPAALLPMALRWHQMSDARWRIVRRFSTWAVSMVILLTASGIMNSICLLGNFAALFQTAYGAWLIVKISLFGMLILIGAANRLILIPRKSEQALLGSIIAELVIGGLILVIVGVLGMLSPRG